MPEREGSREDFLRLLGRTPQPLPPDKQRPETELDEGGSEEEEAKPDEGPNAAELFLKHLNTPKPWQTAILRQLHPPNRGQS